MPAFPSFSSSKICLLFSNVREILTLSRRAPKIPVAINWKSRSWILSLHPHFCIPPVSSTGLAHRGLLSKSLLPGHARCRDIFYRAYGSGLIGGWQIVIAIELRLPWVGFCLSRKELCQDEIKFCKILRGWGSHSRTLIFQRAIMSGLISRWCKTCNIFCVMFCGRLSGMMMKGLRKLCFDSCVWVWPELEWLSGPNRSRCGQEFCIRNLGTLTCSTLRLGVLARSSQDIFLYSVC